MGVELLRGGRAKLKTSLNSTPRPVTYVNVSEYTDDGTGSNGRADYTFRDSDDITVTLNRSAKYYTNSRHWNRGQLLGKTTYGFDGKKKAATLNTYQIYANGTTADITGLLVQVQTVVGGTAYNPNGSGCYTSYTDEYLPTQTYRFDYGVTKLIRTEDITYDDQDESRYTSRATETDYDPAFVLPVETRSFVEGSIVLGTRMSYPQNFPPLSATIGSPDAELTGIRTLQEQNAYIPLETINFRQESPGATKFYKTGKLMTYERFTVLNQPTGLPKRVWLAETDFNNKTLIATGDYQSSAERYGLLPANQKNQFPLDPVWKLRLTYNSYDFQGDLGSYSVESGPTTALTYRHTIPATGIRFSVLTTQQENSGQVSAQTTTYGYVVPLLGPATMTAPNGVTTTYEYDSFGRLARTKDKDGNILNQFTYRYATQP